ncbi:MAG TPA: hypothetical protein VLW86_08590 [Syntrophorhabdales bacterium]|nr:hypothetical protein [Syntrophorhabdales bacterium]
MTISDYQINSVVKTYMRNMKSRASLTEKTAGGDGAEDRVLISEEAMKRMVFERIGDSMTEKLRRHGQEE